MPDPTPSAAAPTAPPRRLHKERVGEVVSDKMTKTIIVRVERRVPHPRFKKVITRYAKFYAHDEREQAGVGDRVLIRECRPLSRTKRWMLVRILTAGRQPVVAGV